VAEMEISRRLRRLDSASSHGAWTWQTLTLIATNPGVRAEDLADSVGLEKMPVKLDVRELKELGLTESLRIGLSPRGEAVVENQP
jgi:DNA-binding Lrp family transcriptional regulator